MTKEEKHKLEQAEFDRDGFERQLRSEQQRWNIEREELQHRLKLLENLDQSYVAELNRAYEDISNFRTQAQMWERLYNQLYAEREAQIIAPDFALSYEEAHQLMYLLDDADYFSTMSPERTQQWENICEKIQAYRYEVESK